MNIYPKNTSKKRRATRGLSLAEILTVIFLLGILGYIAFVLLFPVFRVAGRNAGGNLMAQKMTMVLNTLEGDIRSAAPQGVNQSTSTSGDWTVALVVRLWPTADGATTWSKQINVYHYDAHLHQLQQATVDGPKWPDGTPQLTGGEPMKMTASQFDAASAPGVAIVSGVISDAWPDISSRLKLTIHLEGQNDVPFYRDFSGFLGGP